MKKKSGFILSAFGDEIDDDVDKQFQVLNSLNIGYLDVKPGEQMLLIWVIAKSII